MKTIKREWKQTLILAFSKQSLQQFEANRVVIYSQNTHTHWKLVIMTHIFTHHATPLVLHSHCEPTTLRKDPDEKQSTQNRDHRTKFQFWMLRLGFPSPFHQTQFTKYISKRLWVKERERDQKEAPRKWLERERERDRMWRSK